MSAVKITKIVVDNTAKAVKVYDLEVIDYDGNYNLTLKDTITEGLPFIHGLYTGIYKVFKNSNYYIFITRWNIYAYNYHTKTMKTMDSHGINRGIMYKDHLITDCFGYVLIYNPDMEIMTECKCMEFVLHDKLYSTVFAENGYKGSHEDSHEGSQDSYEYNYSSGDDLILVEIDFTPEFTVTAVDADTRANFDIVCDERFGVSIEKILTKSEDSLFGNLRENNYLSQRERPRTVHFSPIYVRIFGDVYYSKMCYDFQLRRVYDDELIFSIAGCKDEHYIVE